MGIIRVFYGILGGVLALGTWQLFATVGPLAQSSLPPASIAVDELLYLVTTVEMWQATFDTLAMAVTGLVLAAVLGSALGVGIGASPLALHATRGILEFLKPIPPLVILPVVVMVLGPTANMGIFLVFFGTFITMTVQASAGVFDTDPIARSTGLSYGMNKFEILREIMLPSALPYIGTAIRTAAPAALLIAVVAGLLGGGPGLGQSLLLSQLSGNQDALFAYVLILGILGLIVLWASEWGARKLLHWHPQYRKEDA